MSIFSPTLEGSARGAGRVLAASTSAMGAPAPSPRSVPEGSWWEVRVVAWRESTIAKQHGLGAYGVARASVYQERAKKMRLEREELEGSLARLSDVQDTWVRLVTITKTQFLGLPTKAAPLLVNLRTPMQAQAIL